MDQVAGKVEDLAGMPSVEGRVPAEGGTGLAVKGSRGEEGPG